MFNLGISSLDAEPQLLMDTLVCLLKTREDSVRLEPFEVERLVARAL